MMHVQLSIFELFWPKVVLFVRTGPTGFSFHYGFHSPWFRLQVKFCAFRGEFFCRLWNWFDLLLVFLTLHQHLFAFYFLNREHMLFFSACLTQECQSTHDLRQSHSYWTFSVTTVMEIQRGAPPKSFKCDLKQNAFNLLDIIMGSQAISSHIKYHLLGSFGCQEPCATDMCRLCVAVLCCRFCCGFSTRFWRSSQ